MGAPVHTNSTVHTNSVAAGRAFLSGTMPCRAGCARYSPWSCWRPPWAPCLRTRGARTTSSSITRHPNPNPKGAQQSRAPCSTSRPQSGLLLTHTLEPCLEQANEKSWAKDQLRETHYVPWEAVAEEMHAELEPGGPFSLERECGMLAQIEDLVSMRKAGWSETGGQLLMHGAGEEVCGVLVGCYLARRTDFAATMHSLVAEYCSAASTAPPLAPECYCTVRALAAFSSEWAALPTRRVGESFFSVGGASAREPLTCYFPDERGMHSEDMLPLSGLDDFSYGIGFDDSPVVRFLSAAADRNGFHSLMQDSFHVWDSTSRAGPRGGYEHAGWSIAMLCTATLVEIHAPGEWWVRPCKRPGLRPVSRALRPQQPLYTVRVSFG